MRTSEQLQGGEVYSRKYLSDQFQITAATINTGVFRPAGHDSVWLFVTEKKTPDRTQYSDLLDGDTLYMDGQRQGGTDRLIREHEAKGLEILVFYRHKKNEYPGYGFRYEGRFRYVTEGEKKRPTPFVLGRIDSLLATVERDLRAVQVEEEQYREGKQTQTLVNRYERNPRLRAATIRIHGTTCQVCGFDFERGYGPRGRDFIEVHHLRPVASVAGEREVDPQRDMAVVCANCHRMIHRKTDEILGLEELRQLVVSAKGH